MSEQNDETDPLVAKLRRLPKWAIISLAARWADRVLAAYQGRDIGKLIDAIEIVKNAARTAVHPTTGNPSVEITGALNDEARQHRASLIFPNYYAATAADYAFRTALEF